MSEAVKKNNTAYSKIALNDYMRMIIEGKREIDASREIKQIYPELSLRQTALLRKKALSNIKDLRNKNAKELIDLHLLRYEEIYRAAVEMGFDQIAMKAMADKERLLNLHEDQSTKVSFSKTEVNVTAASDFDFSKLDEEKQDRIKVLLDKSRSQTDRQNEYLVNGESKKLRQES